ncbi:MAG: ABC transporter permease [Fimbriimonadaceae bacterium]|jgi:simple sugar transport system permease protein|nr:ABC transporter permease [Fimbriimonadaceae bacterium]
MLSLFVLSLTLSVPLILAALGGLTSERSGVINIGLEGKMLVAACITGLVGMASGNAFVGFLCGSGAAVAMSLLHYLVTQAFRVDHIISGMGLNALAVGLTSVLHKRLTNPDFTDRIPGFPVQVYWVIAGAAVVGIAWYLNRTKGGLRLSAVGNDPDKARQMGVQPTLVRFYALVATGLFCGLAGSLIVTNAGSFTENMTAGKGYIALAALILGGWRPLPALLACILFGFFEALQIQLQGQAILGVDLPSWVWQSLPYFVTIVALAGFLGKNQAPAGLGRP